VAWDDAEPQAAAAGEAVGRAAAGRLVRLYLPTDSPWRTLMARRWRHCRREVTHGELFAAVDAVFKAAYAGFDRDNQSTARG
jgi:hypothetical protein